MLADKVGNPLEGNKDRISTKPFSDVAPHVNIMGEFRDIIHQNGKTTVTDWTRNTIVLNMGSLIAGLMKNESNLFGIQYWAIGSGQDDWSNDNPPSPNKTDIKLVNEIGRKLIPKSVITYLDANGNDSAVRTNTILIKLLFLEGECNGYWREFAIYGGNSTADKDSGVMINHKTHPLIYKTSDMTIERQMKFTFVKKED